MESTEGGMLRFYFILEDSFKEKKGTVEREQETAEPKPRRQASGGWKPADSLEPPDPQCGLYRQINSIWTVSSNLRLRSCDSNYFEASSRMDQLDPVPMRLIPNSNRATA